MKIDTLTLSPEVAHLVASTCKLFVDVHVYRHPWLELYNLTSCDLDSIIHISLFTLSTFWPIFSCLILINISCPSHYELLRLCYLPHSTYFCFIFVLFWSYFIFNYFFFKNVCAFCFIFFISTDVHSQWTRQLRTAHTVSVTYKSFNLKKSGLRSRELVFFVTVFFFTLFFLFLPIDWIEIQM